MGKISVIVRLEVRPDKVDDFPRAWDSVFDHVGANEPDTEHYVLHRAKNKPNIFYVSEIYKEQSAFDTHIGSDAVADLFNSLGDYIVKLDIDISEPIRSAKG
jgi:quinol monooxygenase YgiN